MRFIKVKTRAFRPPRDDIFKLLDQSLPRLREGDILIITSKILSIHQGRCVKISKQTKKDDLILKEAEKFLPRNLVPGQLVILTIKNHTLLPSAGIDSKNGRGYYILMPKHVNKLLKEIWNSLKKKHKVKKLGIIATDSHSIPLRHGTVGISIGFWGLAPLLDYTGQKGVFGGILKTSRANVVDALAAAGTLLMGEAGAKTPMVIARNANLVSFTDKDTYNQLITKPGEDIYEPLLEIFKRADKPARPAGGSARYKSLIHNS